MAGDRLYVLQVYRGIFTQFSHLYTLHTSSRC